MARKTTTKSSKSTKTSPKTTKGTKKAKALRNAKALIVSDAPASGAELIAAARIIEKAEKATKTAKQTTKIKTVPTPKLYTGAPIQATRVFHREMPEFKNCLAECWLILNEEAGTFTTCNTYNGNLKASYDPSIYTYELTEKAQRKIDKKLQDQGYLQIEEIPDYPTWITPATATMDLLPKALQKKVAKLRKSTKTK